MQKLTATYRIVTPLFLGGADQQAQATHIRPPSVKGALRFWWRALNWGRIRSEFQNDANDAKALCELNQQEADLFGAAVDKTERGQSKVLMSISPVSLRITAGNVVHPQFSQYPAARYLGYGLMEAFASQVKNTQAGQLVRSCINEDQIFIVKLNCRDDVLESVKPALIAMGLFGGLGSRSRHGMGSICLESLSQNGKEIWQKPGTLEAYQEEVKALLQGVNTLQEIPPYSAFSRNTRIDVLIDSQTTRYAVLNEFGKAQMMYRSWGHGGMVLGQESEKRFKVDHDWSHIKLRDNKIHPRRVVFGLPHNYGPGVNMQVKSEHHERRSSPLFFHVHSLGDKQFIGVSILLKSVFLPTGERINAGGNQVPAHIEWEVLTNFLDGKDTQNNPRFPGKKQVTV
jgi:CRISPR-associated protein Cmr1